MPNCNGLKLVTLYTKAFFKKYYSCIIKHFKLMLKFMEIDDNKSLMVM